MSAAAIEFSFPHEETTDRGYDEDVAAAADRLLAGGPVEFKLSTRLAESELPPLKRRLFGALRRLPRWLYVPPGLAVQRGIYDDWDKLLKACETPDDQVLALPKNRALGRDARDVAVECRPRDPADVRRFLALRAVFGARPSEPCTEIENRLTRMEDRITALEAKGTGCASGRPV